MSKPDEKERWSKIAKPFGEILKEFRERQNCKIDDFAKSLEISVSTLRALESPMVQSPDILVKIRNRLQKKADAHKTGENNFEKKAMEGLHLEALIRYMRGETGELPAGFSDKNTGDSFPSNIEGTWTYLVIDDRGKHRQRGKLGIRQTGQKIKVRGIRMKSCYANEKAPRKSNAPWESTWGEICTDGRFRFVYEIKIHEELNDSGTMHNGFCCFNLGTTTPRKMTGKYYLLPPFKLDTPNCTNGTIIYTRTGSLLTEAGTRPESDDFEIE